MLHQRYIEALKNGRATRETDIMRASLFAVTSLVAISGANAEPYPATLAGHVVIPALTFLPLPADAPSDLKVSGKFMTTNSFCCESRIS